MKKLTSQLVVLACMFSVKTFAAEQGTTEHQIEATELLREMVAYRTVAGHGQVTLLNEKLAARFLQAGFAKEDVTVIPVESGVSALVVRYRGDGTGSQPVLLMAHVDVVDALADDWLTNPFQLNVTDGYYYGRGVLDNKGGAAAQTMTFLRLKKEGYVPKRDFIIAFTGDEETTGNSMHALVTDHRSLVDAEFALNSDAGGGLVDENGKNSSYHVQSAEKSYMTFEVTIRNRGGHSSRPRLDNAIYDLAAALIKVQNYRFPVRINDITRAYLQEAAKTTHGPVAIAMKRFAENPNDKEAADILFADESKVGQTRTTCIATMLRAGLVENALPQKAVATINCRAFPGETVASVQAKLKEVIANDNAEIQVLDKPQPSPASELNPIVMDAVSKVVRDRFGEIAIFPYMSSGATSGVYTRAAGIPTYGTAGYYYAPHDDRSHGIDERQSIDSFYGSLNHWYALIKELSNK